MPGMVAGDSHVVSNTTLSGVRWGLKVSFQIVTASFIWMSVKV